MVKFGIDYGFLDISYAKLKLKEDGRLYEASAVSGYDDIVSADYGDSYYDDYYDDDDDDDISLNLGMHKLDYSLFVGPSVSVNPWKHLVVAAYFHVKPTASGIIENDTFSYGFGCAMAAGVSVAYKTLSVGVEGQWCNMKYKQTSFDDEEDDDSFDGSYDFESTPNLFSTKNFKLKQHGARFYIALRF